MSEPPDLSVLAKRYVELWQDYLTAAAADPGLADSLARLLAGLGTVAALSPWQAWQRGAAVWRDRSDHNAAARSHDQATSEPSSPAAQERPGAAAPRAAPAASPSHERDDGMAEFARRLARLDERLAALEAGNRRTGSPATLAETRGGRPRARGAARRRRT